MLNRVKKIGILAVVLFSVSCSKDETGASADAVEVSPDFLSVIGDGVYAHGPISASAAGKLNSTAISRNGVIKTQNYFSGTSAANDCTYVVSGKIDSVVKYSDGAHWRLRYSDTDISISSPSSPSAECADFVSQYKFKNIPKTHDLILCGYSRERVDFACNGDTNSPGNWYRKN